MDPQPHNHNPFSKISRTLCTTRNWWIIVIFLQCTRKGKLPFVLINTLLLYIPLLALTHRQTEWRTEKKPTYCAWAGGTFFQLCCCVSFSLWREIGFGVHTYVLRVQYSCGVVLVFWLHREIVFGVRYILSVQYSCAVVSVFWLWWEIDLKMRTPFYKKNHPLRVGWRNQWQTDDSTWIP